MKPPVKSTNPNNPELSVDLDADQLEAMSAGVVVKALAMTLEDAPTVAKLIVEVYPLPEQLLVTAQKTVEAAINQLLTDYKLTNGDITQLPIAGRTTCH